MSTKEEDNMKRILLIMVIGVLVVAVAACGNQDAATTNGMAAQTAQPVASAQPDATVSPASTDANAPSATQDSGQNVVEQGMENIKEGMDEMGENIQNAMQGDNGGQQPATGEVQAN